VERHAQLVTQPFAECGVTVRLPSTDTVMYVGCLETESQAVVAEKVEECYRVRAARERNQHPLTDQRRKAGREVLGESFERHAP
jgi:hypothetical protein